MSEARAIPKSPGDVIVERSEVDGIGLTKLSTRKKSWKSQRGSEKLHGRTEAKVKNDLGERSWVRGRGDPSQTWAVGGYEGRRV